MKGLSDFELITIFGFCILIVGVFTVSVINNFNDTIVLFESRLVADMGAVQGVGSTTCTFATTNKIYFDKDKKQINITYFTYSAPMPYGTCTIDKNLIKNTLKNYTVYYNITY